MKNDKLQEILEQLAIALTKRNLNITTAESCTGGMLSQLLTSVSGASAFFERALITYSNQAKSELLNIDLSFINEYGAVSQEVAEAMAKGAIKNSKSNVAIAITGVAGPSGGSPKKPIGLVYIAVIFNDEIYCTKNHFNGTREEIRQKACIKAIHQAVELIESY